MKLEPVYLLAPEPPKQAAVFSRRALLLSGVVGGALGMALGFGVARGAGEAVPERSAEETDILEWAVEVQSSGDRRLAEECMSFLSVAASHRDPRLHAGMERLARLATDAGSDLLLPSRRVAVARWIEVLVAEWPDFQLPTELTTALSAVR
ncbi:MAG: hypothetical protein AB7I09_20215 [Planctomycetota bacterium]